MGFRPFRFLRAVVTAFALAGPLAPAAFARPAPDSFADLANQLLPVVVNISTTQTVTGAAGVPQLPADLPPDSPLRQLFKDMDKGKNVPRHVTSLGSGFIIDPSGIIVTNNHVVEDADEITVTLNDGTTLPAKLIGRDDKTDLALLKVVAKKPLPAAHFGNSSKARVGDWVMAIGNPFGLGSTVTTGIISARNRDIAAGPYDDFIQTDAPINRGNSGGPLFDMDGNVIGVNSAIFSPSGGSVGIGFAIPSNMAREVIGQLQKYGATRRGWLGVRVQTLTSDLAEGMGVSGASGALVADVTDGGPADKAGIRNGDIITAFDGQPVPDSRALPREVADTPAGKKVNIDIIRGGKKMTLHAVVAKLQDDDDDGGKTKPAPTPKPPAKTSPLGLTLAALDDAARAKYKLPKDAAGVLVTGIDPLGASSDKNFRPGDIIVQVQNQSVRTPDDVNKIVDANAKAGKKVTLLLVSRGGDLTYVAVRTGGAG
ncbi:MAG: DegQ family serine endoprotease [Proteobacteria bacterium]|nr:DegQ family serine endoprotease [Pseudomonadota bacterium]